MALGPTGRTAPQRSHGAAMLRLGESGRITARRQKGCAKAFTPRAHRPVTEAVFVNTAGGLTGGDRYATEVELDPGAALVATTQAAERIYRSAGGVARVTARARLGRGARLSWLPQETILFDGSRLDRLTEVEMAEDAELVLAEMLVLGRHAMGESNIAAEIVDTRRIRRGGRLILHDAQRLRLPLPAGSTGPLLGGGRALATIICVASAAEDRLGAARAALPAADSGVEAAASAWEGRLVLRLLSRDAQPLRRALARCLGAIRGGPCPRVWSEEEVTA